MQRPVPNKPWDKVQPHRTAKHQVSLTAREERTLLDREETSSSGRDGWMVVFEARVRFSFPLQNLFAVSAGRTRTWVCLCFLAEALL